MKTAIQEMLDEIETQLSHARLNSNGQTRLYLTALKCKAIELIEKEEKEKLAFSQVNKIEILK